MLQTPHTDEATKLGAANAIQATKPSGNTGFFVDLNAPAAADGAPCAQFAVATDVSAATTPLPPWPAQSDPKQYVAEAFGVYLEVKAASAPHPHLVKIPHSELSSPNPFAQAVCTAFFDHYPLAMYPHSVWLAVMQGFAQHVKDNAEQLRAQFVAHEGKADITVEDAACTWGAPPDVWASQVPKYEGEVHKRLVGGVATALNPTFTTTTFDSRAAVTVCLMDMMQHYFAYGLRGGCGIPAVHLHGTADDWTTLRAHAGKLRGFGCDEWVTELELVLDHFVASATLGKADDVGFWAKTCTVLGGSGSEVPFNGWINVFFPYLKAMSFAHSLPHRPLQFEGVTATAPKITFNVQPLDRMCVQIEASTKHRLLDVMLSVQKFGVAMFSGRTYRDLTTPLWDIHGFVAACADGALPTLTLMPASCVELLLPNSDLKAWRTEGGGAFGAKGNNPSEFPSGISSAPVAYEDLSTRQKYPLTFKAGFTGVIQDPKTLAVSASVGWVVALENA